MYAEVHHCITTINNKKKKTTTKKTKTIQGQKYIIDIQKPHCITLFQDDMTILERRKKKKDTKMTTRIPLYIHSTLLKAKETY